MPLGSIINGLFPRWFHLFVTYIAKGKISLCFHYVVRILVYLARLPRKADINQVILGHMIRDANFRPVVIKPHVNPN